MASSSEIINLIQRFRRGVLNGDKTMITELTRAYGLVWERIRVDVRQLTAQIEQARERGETINEAWLFQNDRLQSLLTQVEQEISGFANGSLETTITGRQMQLVDMATNQMQAVVDEVSGPGAKVSLGQLPREAIMNLVGLLPDGSPLATILDELKKDGSQHMREALIKGVSLGWNPRKIEREAREANGRVLQRALTVARTEALRPYREAQYQMRQQNKDLISGWVWLSAADSRTCASCWAMHGTRHRNNERLDDHPNGRCTEIPLVNGFSLRMETGEERFKRLPASNQQKILRGEKYQLYKDGQVALTDFVHRSRSKTWGTHRREKSVKELQNA
jgi:SPP1 gp7 family putative phage head morphogenesis protein